MLEAGARRPAALLALAVAGLVGCTSVGTTTPSAQNLTANASSAARTSAVATASTPGESSSASQRSSAPNVSAALDIPTLTASSGTLHVVALGDSVPSGAGCGCTPFPELVGPLLQKQTGRSVAVDNRAVGGQTSSDVLDELGDPAVRSSIRAADVVIVEIGANDFDESLANSPNCVDPLADSCHAPVLAQTKKVLNQITSSIQELNHPADARIVLLGYWNVFRDGDVGAAKGPTYVAASSHLTDDFNDVVEQVAAENDVLYADTLTPFKGDGSKNATFALAPDGNHPNSTGHHLIAQAVVDSLQQAGALTG